MSVVSEYIKYNKGLVILISGLSGSNRTVLAKEIERDFKITLINLELYCNKENTKVFELPNDIKVRDWEHIDVYDWDKFNNDVLSAKTTGVIMYGDYFPTFKLKFNHDFHIHIKISKEKLIEKRKEYIEKNPEKCAEMLEFVNNNNLDILINKITYPYYIEYREKSKIDKYLNSDKNTTDEMYDQAFEYIIFSMKKFLNEHTVTNNKNDQFIKNDILKPVSEKKYISSDTTNDVEDKDDSDTTEDGEDGQYLGTTHNEAHEAYYLP